MCPICLVVALVCVLVVGPALACAQMPAAPQTSQSGRQASAAAMSVNDDMGDMPGMDAAQRPSAIVLMQESSGTSVQPRGWAMPMLMERAGGWQVGWMAQAFVVDVQQSHVNTPTGTLQRGGDKVYSTNWGMVAAQHPLGGGDVMLRSMVSLEPATITGRLYPELFQTGETAFGQPIVDGQHPHNLVMEVGAQYAHAVATTVASVYYAPVGDPALGPTAYPHRASAAQLPQATLGHHFEDSTHIAANVVTTELAWKALHLEASGFYGREPGENRWTIGFGGMDSWSGRVTWMPARDWQAQVSTGRLHHPEADAVGDEERTTASVEFVSGERAASVIWGRDYKTAGHYAVNALTAEGVWPVSQRNAITGRFEWSQRDELFADQPALEATLPRWFDVEAGTLGYAREIARRKNTGVGVGANVTAYAVHSGSSLAQRAISGVYGERPWGVSVYVRVGLRPN